MSDARARLAAKAARLRSLAQAHRESGDRRDARERLAAAEDIDAVLGELEALHLVRLAAREVVERWDTPLWKDVEPTAAVINRLRGALDAWATAAPVVFDNSPDDLRPLHERAR